MSTPDWNRFLVLGCGGMAAATQDKSHLGHLQWTRMRLEDGIYLDPAGPEFEGPSSSVCVALADELDGRAGWLPDQKFQGTWDLKIRREQPLPGPILSPWSRLAHRQAEWATKKMGGPGVLVTPSYWARSNPGQELLKAWGRHGWGWAPLEEVVRRSSSGARFVSAGHLWLRLNESGNPIVMPNGIVSALAVEGASAILNRLLERLDGDLAARWRSEEMPLSGWFVSQQLARCIAAALREDRGQVDLGGAESPIFRFSTDESQKVFSHLSSLRVTVRFPQAPDEHWWDLVTQSGYLRSPGGGIKSPNVRWGGSDFLVLEGPNTGGILRYLNLKHLEYRKLAPADLSDALEMASPVEKGLAELETRTLGTGLQAGNATEGAEPVQKLMTRKEHVPPAEELVADVPPLVVEEASPLESPFASFRPEIFALNAPHRSDRLRVWVDGQLFTSERLRKLATPAAGGTAYRIQGAEVPRGAIVRVDFEPPIGEGE